VPKRGIADPKTREKLKNNTTWVFKGKAQYGKDILESHLAYQDAAYGVSFKREVKNLLERLKRPVRIVSIGEGDSTFLEELRRHFGARVELHAVDIAEKEHHPQIMFHQTGMEDLSKLPQNHFDIAVATRSMLYVMNTPGERRNALNQIHRVLGPGGIGYIHPEPGPMWWPFWLPRWIKKNQVERIQTPLPALIFRKAGEAEIGTQEIREEIALRRKKKSRKERKREK